MGNVIAARVHCWLAGLYQRVAEERGQGTVEYVGTVVMVTLLIVAVAALANNWAPGVGAELKKALISAITRLQSAMSASP
jgi:hypothetical protein